MDGYELTLQDFLGYTEVDVGADRIQRTATEIKHLARCDETTQVYRSLANYIIADFEMLIDVQSDFKDTDSRGIVLALQQNTLDWTVLCESGIEGPGTENELEVHRRGIAIDLLYTGGSRRIGIIQRWMDGMLPTIQSDYWLLAEASTPYYLRLKRVDDIFTMQIYDDATARDEETHDMHLLRLLKLYLKPECEGATAQCKYKYIFGCNTWNYGTTEEQNNIIRSLKLVLWSDPTKAFDGDVATYSESWAAPNSWSPFLILTRSTSMKSAKVKFYVSGTCSQVDIDAWTSHGWVGLFEGSVNLSEMVEKTFKQTCVSKLRIRGYNAHGSEVRNIRVHQIEFEAVSAPSADPVFTPLKNSAFPYTFPFKFSPYEDWADIKMVDPAIAGYCRAGCFRAGVLNPIFERIVQRLKQLGKSTRVLWLKRVEGERHFETGQPIITFEEREIDCFFSAPGGGATSPSDIGVKDERLYRGFTMEPLTALDRVIMPFHGHVDKVGRYDSKRTYEVQDPQEVFEGGGFLYRTFTLKHLDQLQPIH